MSWTTGRERSVCRGAVCVLLALAGCLIPAVPASAAPQPSWPARCPLTVGLLVDRSSSMASSFAEVRGASKDLVDALRGRHTQVTIIGFGTAADVLLPLTDVARQDARRRVKSAIGDLDALSGDQAGTNWDAALQLAGQFDLSVVVILSDGDPTVSGAAVGGGAVRSGDPEAALAAARVSADRLKTAGTRVVPVGIGLRAGSEQHLAAISGPVPGDDYYSTNLTGLRRQLYDIASKSCGIPVAALPTPEPPGFPLREALVLTFLVLAGLLGAGLLVQRLRRGPRRAGPRPPPVRGRAAVTPPAPLTIEAFGPGAGLMVEEPGGGGGSPAGRQANVMSLDFLEPRRAPGNPPGRPDDG